MPGSQVLSLGARSWPYRPWAVISMLLCLSGCGQTNPPDEPAAPPANRTESSASLKSPEAGSKAPPNVAGADSTEQRAAGENQVSAASSAGRETALYIQHCAACHGEKGDGQGIAAKFLFPKPRDFRAGRFRLISTTNGVPTEADIDAVLVRGMPGSAMLSWAHLSEADRKLLVKQVLELRRQGAREVELALAADSGDELSEDQIQEAVDQATAVGPAFDTPAIGDADAASVARGREVYMSKGCAACHGNEGKGDGQQVMVDAEGLPTRPRDLTLGTFKGSSDPVPVYQRIALGMPGTPMPSSQGLVHEQVADLVHYIRSISDEAIRQATVLKRQRLLAVAVAKLPSGVGAEAWTDIKPVAINMVPLWWRDDADPGLEVQAAHDGKSLAVRLSWRDTTPDRDAARSQAFKDAAAIELYRGTSEPFVGMGAMVAPVDVWMWDADRDSGPTDVNDANPNLVVDIYPLTESLVDTAEYKRPGTATSEQVALTLPAKAVGNQIVPSGEGSGGTALVAGGPGSMTFRLPVNQHVDAHGAWHDGQWAAVFTRPMKLPDQQDGLSLSPGDRVSAAFAVWDGSHRDRNGQKLITIWQDLELETPSKR